MKTLPSRNRAAGPHARLSGPPVRANGATPRFSFVVLLGLAALALSVYGRSLGHGFVFDDETQIVGNAAIQDLGNVPSLFLSSTNHQNGSERLEGIYYKPLMTTAYALLWAVAGPSGAVFHAALLALAAFNAWLLYLTLALRNAARPWTAAVAAALFLVHPANSEVALYAADLQDLLYFAFGLSALLLASREGRPTLARAAGVSGLLLAALLSKESGVLFVGLVFVWTILFRRERWRAASGSCAAALAAYFALRFGLAGLTTTVGASWAQIAHASFFERALTMPAILAHYARLALWPDRLVVAQDWVVRSFSLEATAAPLALAAALAGFGWRASRGSPDKRWAAFCAAATGAGLLLHLQIVPLDGTVADRWIYVPLFGLFAWAAPLAERAFLASGPRGRAAIGAAAVMTGAAYAAVSWARVGDWSSGLALYRADEPKDPENGLLQNNLGVELFRAGQKAEALERFERATRLSPHWTIPWNNLGAAYEAFGRVDEAERAYKTSVDKGLYFLAYENYPLLLYKLGKKAQALKFVEEQGLPALPYNRTLLGLRAELRSGRP